MKMSSKLPSRTPTTVRPLPNRPIRAVTPANFSFQRLLTGVLLTSSLSVALSGCSNGLPEPGSPDTSRDHSTPPRVLSEPMSPSEHDLSEALPTPAEHLPIESELPAVIAAPPAVSKVNAGTEAMLMPESARMLQGRSATLNSADAMASTHKRQYTHPVPPPGIDPPIYRPTISRSTRKQATIRYSK